MTKMQLWIAVMTYGVIAAAIVLVFAVRYSLLSAMSSPCSGLL